jgi:hypothetical protein
VPSGTPAVVRPERIIHHPAMPATKVPAVTRDAVTTCVKAVRAVELVSTAQMLSSSARPVSGL